MEEPVVSLHRLSRENQVQWPLKPDEESAVNRSINNACSGSREAGRDRIHFQYVNTQNENVESDAGNKLTNYQIIDQLDNRLTS